MLAVCVVLNFAGAALSRGPASAREVAASAGGSRGGAEMQGPRRTGVRVGSCAQGIRIRPNRQGVLKEILGRLQALLPLRGSGCCPSGASDARWDSNTSLTGPTLPPARWATGPAGQAAGQPDPDRPAHDRQLTESENCVRLQYRFFLVIQTNCKHFYSFLGSLSPKTEPRQVRTPRDPANLKGAWPGWPTLPTKGGCRGLAWGRTAAGGRRGCIRLARRRAGRMCFCQWPQTCRISWAPAETMPRASA